LDFGFWILDCRYSQGDGLAEALGEIGVAAGPVENALQEGPT
jgi:hypothetical protein